MTQEKKTLRIGTTDVKVSGLKVSHKNPLEPLLIQGTTDTDIRKLILEFNSESSESSENVPLRMNLGQLTLNTEAVLTDCQLENSAYTFSLSANWAPLNQQPFLAGTVFGPLFFALREICRKMRLLSGRPLRTLSPAYFSFKSTIIAKSITSSSVIRPPFRLFRLPRLNLV